MASTYQGLFAVPGSRAFVAAGFVGRMSMSMIGIGIVLLVSAVTGSYGIAGAVAASWAIASAAVSPVAGRLTDRHGQRRVLLAMSIGTVMSTATLIACAQLNAPTWALFPAAAALGLASPSLGAMVRARWSHLADTPARLQAAYSFESVADEIIFVTGPTIVTVLATGVHPAAGVAAAGALTVTGCLSLAAQHRTEPPPWPHPGGATGGVLAIPGMLVLAAVFFLLGALFGSIEVAGVAFAANEGQPWAAGPLLGTLALGSAVAGLWYGARHWRGPLHRRFVIGLALLAAGLVPVALAGSLPVMMVVIFFAGLAVSPTLIPAFGLVQRLVPDHQLTEGLGWVSTAIGIGLAVGSSVAGRIVDVHGTGVAFGLPLGAALLAAAVGGAGLGALRLPAEHPSVKDHPASG